jgi:hypothetical protein
MGIQRLSAWQRPRFPERPWLSLERLAEKPSSGQLRSSLILLDDRAFGMNCGWIDPMLAVSVIDGALRKSFKELDKGLTHPGSNRSQDGST